MLPSVIPEEASPRYWRRRMKAFVRLALLSVATITPVGFAASCSDPTATYDSVRTRWLVPQAGYASPRPLVIGSRVFVATGDDRVVARNVGTGAIEWSTSVGPGRASGTELVAGNGTLVVSIVQRTFGLDIATGRQLWIYAAPPDTVDDGGEATAGQVVHSIVATDGTNAYIPAWGASVSAVDLRSGIRRWAWTPGISAGDTSVNGIFRSGASGVTVAGDTVFVTMWHYLQRIGQPSEIVLVALDARTGREHYRVPLPTYTNYVASQGAPIVVGRIVYVFGIGGTATAIDRETRAILWRFEGQNPTNGTATAGVYRDGVIYIDSGNEHITAVRASDGTVVWSTKFRASFNFALLVTERYVYGPRGQVLFIFDRRTGAIVRELRQPGAGDASFIASAPAEAGGRIFLNVPGAAWSFDEP